MRRRVLVLGLAVACFFAAKRLTIRHVAYAQIRAVPFVLEVDSYNFESSPGGTLFHKKVIARRPDGATAVISTVGPLERRQTMRKVTLLTGQNVAVFDALKAKTTWQMNQSQLAFLKQRLENTPSSCVFNDEEQRAGSDTVLGHPVFVIESKGDLKSTQWRAPDLGCEPLRNRIEKRNSGGAYVLVSEGRGVSLKLGEPDAQYFAPTTYKEITPSEAQRRVLQKLGTVGPAETY